MGKCIVARNIEGCGLNDYEYLLEYTGEIKVFDSNKSALEYLNMQGVPEDEIYFMRFFDYERYLTGELMDIHEARFRLEEDSACYGCRHFVGSDNEDDDVCQCQSICIDGSVNDYEI